MTDTKRQPLPWFAFNVGEYVKDTMRLGRDGHGAYLLLMLDYYGTASPCPDDDFILAAVTKSTPEEWKQLRRVLAPFFDIREGHWYHKRIEREMQEACSLHADRTAQAQAAAHARWSKEGSKPAKSTAPTHPRTAKPRKNAPSNAAGMPVAMPTAMPEQSSEDAHKQKHPSLTEGGEAPPAQAVDEGLGTPIDRGFTPDPSTSDRARAAGMSVAEIDAEVRKFIGMKLADGAWSHDWQGSFAVFIEREIAHRAKQVAKAPPRIEVNAAPSEEAISRQLNFFVRGGAWSHKAFGPEPGMLGCRIPADVLQAHGIDPRTGAITGRAKAS